MPNALYDYSPIIDRPRLKWPNGARLAFWIGVNIEYYEPGKPSTILAPSTANLLPDPLNYGWREYGPRVGIWRLMETLKEYEMRASVLLNSDVCRFYPQIVQAAKERDWVWLAHGKNNSTLQTDVRAHQERRYLTEVVTAIKESTGHQPKGWLGPVLTETLNTPDILAELGITYICDWCNDDQPYPCKVKHGRMISIPYSVEINDIEAFVSRGLTGQEYLQQVIDQFDVLYDEGTKSGKVMCLPIHPFVLNQPFRHKYLERALDYITSHKKVWITTSDEIADWYYEQYYSIAVNSKGLKKEES